MWRGEMMRMGKKCTKLESFSLSTGRMMAEKGMIRQIR